MIGLNLSPISPKYNGVSYNQYIKDMFLLVLSLSDYVVFIPHDSQTHPSMGKLKYTADLFPIYDVNKQLNNKIKITDELDGCDIIITFRMHLAIHAICRGIRTIYIGYYWKQHCLPRVSHLIYMDYTADIVERILDAEKKLRKEKVQRFPITSEINIKIIKEALGDD